MEPWSISTATAIDEQLLITSGALGALSIVNDVASTLFAERRLSTAIAVVDLRSPISAILRPGRALS